MRVDFFPTMYHPLTQLIEPLVIHLIYACNIGVEECVNASIQHADVVQPETAWWSPEKAQLEQHQNRKTFESQIVLKRFLLA